MKTFEGENYYQILQVSADANAVEIRHAYRGALAIYEEGSIATYSLFSAEQREVLLRAIEKAFDTLIDEEKKAAYNQMLIDTGQVEASFFSRHDQRNLANNADAQGMSREKSLKQWVQKKADEPEIRQIIEQILSNERLSGAELKRLREAFGIELTEIYGITRIRETILSMIEADRFDELPAEIYLKQFIKSYAEILQIDAQHAVKTYFAFKESQKNQAATSETGRSP
jgi:curved DNA-binding protein CbpA